MSPPHQTRSVAVIGAGAAGAAAAVALAAEKVFETIKVFERRETTGGTWIYDADPGNSIPLQPGKTPPDIDPPLQVPSSLPASTSPSSQPRYETTPIYAELTTNVPDIIMSFSDNRFAYGPFVPHWIPQQYIQNYFSLHKADKFLVLNTTVEDLSLLPGERWKLTLRRFDPIKHVDLWWEEIFDAVVIANGHYSIPYIPQVPGLSAYIEKFPNRVSHSKSYRTPSQFANRTILIIGNSASGHDITTQLLHSHAPALPIYQSRRSKSRWDGPSPPAGIIWKPTIQSYNARTRHIIFSDGSVLHNIDCIIYCTGYAPSFPFWNARANGGALYNYSADRLQSFYQHTISTRHPHTLAIIGLPRVLTFRSFEYQAVAVARLFSRRNAVPLPSTAEMVAWEARREAEGRERGKAFHTIGWDDGETMEWFRWLYGFAGLPVLEGWGRCPPVLGKRERWVYEHVRKYPDAEGENGGVGKGIGEEEENERGEEEWVVVPVKDSAHFI